MMEPLNANESRILSDRRSCPTPVISRYTLLGGRRKTIRRIKDKKKHLFVDLYSTRLLFIILALLLLSCIDAYLTLALINKGTAYEVNPLMAFFLDYGSLPFTLIKFIITAIALIVLCILKNVKITRITLPVVIKIYIAVIVYEFYLFML